jgi:hypothetical protein
VIPTDVKRIEAMKSSGKKTTPSATSRGMKSKPMSRKMAKAGGAKTAAKKVASKNGKKQRPVRSTVPPQFRELRQLAAKNDPRFWKLRDEFRDYFRCLPEEEIGIFWEGLGQPYLDYLALALIQSRV